VTIDPESAIRLSLIVAAFSTVMGFPIATGLGYLLARKEFFGKSLLSALVMAPLVLPPVVTGLLLLRVLGRSSPLGAWLHAHGVDVPFSLAGAVLAAFVVGLPLYVLTARSAFETVDVRFEAVSLTLGVPPWRTFLRVSLPLALPGLAAGAVLAFARALGEFGATVVLAGSLEGETRTIALAVYALLEVPSGEHRIRELVLASLALALFTLMGYEALTRWHKRRLAA